MATRDQLDRPLGDLRISVTDRCNMRCAYCMPKEVFGRDYPFLERDQLLSYEEVTRLVRPDWLVEGREQSTFRAYPVLR